MAKVIDRKLIFNSEDGIGYSETLYEDMNGEQVDRFVEPVLWTKLSNGEYHCMWPDGSGSIEETTYGFYCKPSVIEYENYYIDEGKTGLTMSCGIRFWDSKPTESEMENTKWEVLNNERL